MGELLVDALVVAASVFVGGGFFVLIIYTLRKIAMWCQDKSDLVNVVMFLATLSVLAFILYLLFYLLMGWYGG